MSSTSSSSSADTPRKKRIFYSIFNRGYSRARVPSIVMLNFFFFSTIPLRGGGTPSVAFAALRRNRRVNGNERRVNPDVRTLVLGSDDCERKRGASGRRQRSIDITKRLRFHWPVDFGGNSENGPATALVWLLSFCRRVRCRASVLAASVSVVFTMFFLIFSLTIAASLGSAGCLDGYQSSWRFVFGLRAYWIFVMFFFVNFKLDRHEFV